MPGEGEDASEVPVQSTTGRQEVRKKARETYPRHPTTVKSQAETDEWARSQGYKKGETYKIGGQTFTVK